MATNGIIRREFLKSDASQALLKKSYEKFDFNMLSLPNVLKEKGVHDATKLPKYYYRDDALSLWSAIETFIQEVLSITYKSDDDIAKDNELQAWIRDIHKNGFPARESKSGHGFPQDLSTLDQLVHVLTCVVFTCSCQHAALNFGLMDAHSFVPFTPSIMRLPPPTKKNETTLNTIMEMLPNKSQASRQIALMYVLSQFAVDERFLGDITQTLLTGDDAEEAISRFQASLQAISNSIKTRNKALEMPYINLLPERIPDSIAI
ncbi:allene oxide synthase-lipoxygenase protein-like [Montipora capricornis]|uniref:allene oxide synthase-lipoxygenase protein-like n=1 Tax=Montipora capricornis TaxID=246305 RepID=UPI0035F165DF